MNELLQSYTDKIRKYEIEIQNTYMYIGMNLHELSNMDCLKESEYKNIAQYAFVNFGYEKTKTYNIMQIYEKFFMEEMKSHKRNLTYRDFSISQLRYMLNYNDELLKLCFPSMTVKEISELKNKNSARAESVSIANTRNLEKCIPGQNVITGVFPEKSETEIEEKQETIIVSSLPDQPEPKPEFKETKIIVDVKQQSDHKDSFELKPDVDYETLYIVESQKYFESEKRIKNLTDISMGYRNLLRYFFEKLSSINGIQGNTELNILKKEINEYLLNKKLPEKLNFMEKVI